MRRRLLRAARPLSLAAAALVLAAAGAAAADISPTYQANAVPWGDGGGTTWAKIGAPAGLAASPDGKRFYVADSGNHRIGVLGPEGRQGFVDMWGGDDARQGADDSSTDPRGVAVDPWGTVVVADTGNERIQRIASDGTYLGSIDLPGVVAVATDSVGSIYALSRFFNTVVWMTSTGKRIAVWQARPPVAAEPLEAWSHPPTGNTKPRMTVRRAVYTLSGITAAPDGTVIVTGNRRLETSYDCAAVSEQLPKKNPPTGNDPTIQHAYAWAFDPANGRLLAATDLTRENRRALGEGAEACWSTWDGNGDAGSLVVGPNGKVVAGVNSNMWEGTLEAGAASPVRFRWYVRNPNPLGKSWGRSVRLALTCRGDLLATSVWSGHVFQYTREADPLPGCNARPPKSTAAIGSPVLAPSGRSVTATVACPGKGCSIVVGLEPARRCKACRGLLPKVKPKAVRLPAGGTAPAVIPADAGCADEHPCRQGTRCAARRAEGRLRPRRRARAVDAPDLAHARLLPCRRRRAAPGPGRAALLPTRRSRSQSPPRTARSRPCWRRPAPVARSQRRSRRRRRVAGRQPPPSTATPASRPPSPARARPR